MFILDTVNTPRASCYRHHGSQELSCYLVLGWICFLPNLIRRSKSSMKHKIRALSSSSFCLLSCRGRIRGADAEAQCTQCGLNLACAILFSLCCNGFHSAPSKVQSFAEVLITFTIVLSSNNFISKLHSQFFGLCDSRVDLFCYFFSCKTSWSQTLLLCKHIIPHKWISNEHGCTRFM